MISRRGFLAGAAALAPNCGRKRATGYRGFAFVANAEGRAIAAVDLTAFAVVRHVALDANPTEVIAHPASPAVYALTPSTGVVHEVDLRRLAVARKFQAGSQALSIRVPWEVPDRLFVAYHEPKRLACFDLTRGSLDWQIPLPANPVDFDVAGDGRHAVVSFGAQGSLGVVDASARKLELIQAGSELGLARFRLDGRAILTADAGARRLLIYDAALRKLVVRLPLAVRPDQFCFGGGGGQLFITGDGLDAVVVVYPYETQVAETVLAGRRPGAMATSSGATPYLFLASPDSGDVTIMNMTTRRVVALASVGSEPGFIAVTPDNQYALVLNRKSGDMGVLRIHDRFTTQRKSAGLFTMIPVGSKPVSAAVRSV